MACVLKIYKILNQMVGFQKINLLDSIHIYVTRIKIEILLEEWEESQIKYYFKKGERCD